MRPRNANAALRTRRNRWLLLSAPALGVSGVTLVLSDRGQALLSELLPRWQTTQDFTIGAYRVQTLDDREGLLPSEFVVTYRGERVYVGGEEWNVGCVGKDGDGMADFPVGTDFLRLGMPTLVLHFYSGGAHCCSTYLILGLPGGGAVVPLAYLDGAHTGCEFRDLDRDGVYECLLRDWTFAYWNTCFTDSPAPNVILQWVHDGFELATEFMDASPPTDLELIVQAEAIRYAAQAPDLLDASRPPSEYWGALLDLIYSGNAESAGRLAKLAWPPEMNNREAFFESFRGQLETSPYWPALQTWNAKGLAAAQRADDEIATHEK